MEKVKSPRLENLLEYLFVVVGTGLYALGTYYFITPSNIAPGGVSGIAIMVNYLTGAPIGLITAAINLPLLIIGWRRLGREFLMKTLLSVVSFTVIYDYILTPLQLPVYGGERLMSCLFGGVLVGAGLGIVFYFAGSTGGTDIVSKLLNQRFPHLQLGRVMLMVDFCVILASVLVFGSIESALYAVITVFVNSQVIDVVVYSTDKGKLVYVFSEWHEAITNKILQDMDRGVTLLHGEGGYTHKDKKVLLCAVRTSEYHHLKKIVRRIDPNAFIIAADSAEVMGEGFKSVEEG
ncbi:MAG: YitT family protein [Oscillospiraceae bacterium]|nr:YitT family protein [Oscillospiraceae bacterium]